MTDHRTRTGALLAGLLLAAAAAAVYLMAVGTRPGQVIDDAVMQAVSGRIGITVPTSGPLGRLQLPLLVTGGIVLLLTCLARRSVRVLVRAVLIVAGTVGAAMLLKHGLGRPPLGIAPLDNSYPSNTVAAVAALASALLVSAPRALRGWIAVPVALVGAAVSVAVVAWQWHRPSDVLGAWLITGAVTAAAVWVTGAGSSGPGRVHR